MYSFRSVAGMEWRKLRGARSAWVIMAVFAACLIGLAMAVLARTRWPEMTARHRAMFDSVNDGYTGLVLGLLLLGSLGVLAISGEFSTGLIRVTFAAVPRRGLVLAAKAAVLGAVTLAAGETLAFAAFFAGQAMLAAPAPHASLGQPGVLRAVLMAGAYPALAALIGLGTGALVRRTPVAIAIIIGVVFVPPLLLAPLDPAAQAAIEKFLPEQMAENSMTAVHPAAHALSPALSLGLLCLYAAIALAAGGWALARREP